MHQAPAQHPGGATQEVVVLDLYVAGQTQKSRAAIANLKKICDQHLAGRNQCRVIDLMLNPQLAREDGIVALPTLIRRMPLPVHKILGDLSDIGSVLAGLGLREPALEHQAKGEAHD